MNRQATFDPAKDLTLYFRCNRAGSKVFTFVRSDASAYSFVYLELQLNIFNYHGEKSPIISLEFGSGLSVTNNQVTASITKALSNINEGEYYFELYRPDIEKTWICGDAIFHNGKFDGVNSDSASITVEENGETIEITVNDGQVLNTRSYSQTTATTVTPDIDNYDAIGITAQASAITIANPTGTPVNFNGFVIRIKDNGTARAITFDSKYRAVGAALPTTTTINKTLYIAFTYNSADDKYDVLPSQVEQ